MAYEKQTWSTGDTVTAAKLNHIEDGISEAGSLPAVTSADNGKVLAVEDGAWAASEQGKKFIVTLTPTSPDFSGTMDKTVAQINEAYEAGQEIVFRVYVSSAAYYEIGCTDAYFDPGFVYPNYCAVFVYDSADAIVKISTPMGDDGTLQAYGTTVYSLTHAS